LPVIQERGAIGQALLQWLQDRRCNAKVQKNLPAEPGGNFNKSSLFHKENTGRRQYSARTGRTVKSG
jgi:hypothetical protein